MNKRTFWKIIDEAWKDIGSEERYRFDVLNRNVDALEFVRDVIPKFVAMLSIRLSALDDVQLCSFDEILERMLHAIDRPELYKYTYGSDDGFLYIRGFVVALGREYYEAVDADESLAMWSWRYYCEEMTYVYYFVDDERGDRVPVEHRFDRESFKNNRAWARAKDQLG
jgi:hypothetical protein